MESQGSAQKDPDPRELMGVTASSFVGTKEKDVFSALGLEHKLFLPLCE